MQRYVNIWFHIYMNFEKCVCACVCICTQMHQLCQIHLYSEKHTQSHVIATCRHMPLRFPFKRYAHILSHKGTGTHWHRRTHVRVNTLILNDPQSHILYKKFRLYFLSKKPVSFYCMMEERSLFKDCAS